MRAAVIRLLEPTVADRFFPTAPSSDGLCAGVPRSERGREAGCDPQRHAGRYSRAVARRRRRYAGRRPRRRSRQRLLADRPRQGRRLRLGRQVCRPGRRRPGRLAVDRRVSERGRRAGMAERALHDRAGYRPRRGVQLYQLEHDVARMLGEVRHLGFLYRLQRGSRPLSRYIRRPIR